MISATITFKPTSVGARNAALVISDTTNSAKRRCRSHWHWPRRDGKSRSRRPAERTYITGFSGPTSVVADPAGDVFVADSAAGKVYEIPAGSTTPAAIGSGFVNPNALAFDANGDLFIADDGLPAVLEIANTGTTGAFAAGTRIDRCQQHGDPRWNGAGKRMGIAVGTEWHALHLRHDEQASGFLQPDHRPGRRHSCHLRQTASHLRWDLLLTVRAIYLSPTRARTRSLKSRLSAWSVLSLLPM